MERVMAVQGRCRSFGDLKDQQLVFLLVRQLAQAQFMDADRRLSQRLWNEVAALNLDPERITRLLYGGIDPNDRSALERLDDNSPRVQGRVRQGWLGWGARGGGHRIAPPAAAPAHRPTG